MQFYQELSGFEFLIIAFAFFVDGIEVVVGLTGGGEVFDLVASLFITPFFIFLLWMSNNIYSWWELVFLAIGKEIPLLNMAPGYTALTKRHITKSKEARKAAQGATSSSNGATEDEGETPDLSEAVPS